MREILFRAKDAESGKWIEGYYVHLHKTTYCVKEDHDRNPDNELHKIVFEQMTDWGLPNKHLMADVLPETVGQFTGLVDKNHKRVFTGDIVKARHNENYYICEICHCKLIIHDKHGNEIDAIRQNLDWLECEVIGNIYDNPELLQVEK